MRSLGYAVVDAADLQAWRSFGVDLLGMQLAEDTADRLRFRVDEQAYRLEVRSAGTDGVSVLGWEVAGPQQLDALVDRLDGEGFDVERLGPAQERHRCVSGLARVLDPDGRALELFYGLAQSTARFVSPTGARFVTGTGGLGHALQRVSDVEAFRHLYVDLFGFRVSDYLETPKGTVGHFLHCNPRHHSFAFAESPDPGVGHLMLEVDDLDIVGRAYDKVLDGAAPLLSTLGRHTNDHMVSMYVRSPSGMGIEYGYGGLLIDDRTWTPSRFDSAHFWGHHKVSAA